MIVFTGGGTGGHVYPGLAVIDELEAGGFFINRRLCWIGSAAGLERDIVTERGIEFIAFPAGKLRRYFSFRNLADLFKVAWAVVLSVFFMLRHRPELLFSKGGYVSVPPVVAAGLCRIPVITHESDLDPGLATRINARFASRICVSYEKTRDYFPPSLRRRVVVTGNPIRREVRAGSEERGRRLFGLDSKRPLILIIGGSLGAVQINEMIAAILPDILPAAQVVHQTGGGNQASPPADGYVPREYIKSEMADLLAAADLVVSRAGAGTLWECASLGKAMILIPLDEGGSRGDQLRNAAFFSQAGAAEVLEGEAVEAGRLKELIQSLLRDPEKRKLLGESARRIASMDAAREAATVVDRLVEQGPGG